MEPSAEPVLPYPHARNDCGLYREIDVDFEIAEPPARPGGKPPRFCQGCLGQWMVTQAFTANGRGREVSPAEPLTVTVTLLAPGGGSW
jgi:hypothetical protein